MKLAGPDLIYIMGVSSRTGTTLMSDLLAAHPACARSPLGEDYLIHEADPLIDYIDRIRLNGIATPDGVHLEQLFGGVLAQALRGDATRPRVVCKTPSTLNIDRFSQLLPNTPLLVMMRDGRDCVASMMRAFDYSFERACRQWSDGVMRLHDYRTHNPVAVVRFESLVQNRQSSLEKIMKYVDLDALTYDFEAAEDAPVRGTAFHGPITWRPMPAPEGFNPIGRWENWHSRERTMFDRLAGDAMKAAGYYE